MKCGDTVFFSGKGGVGKSTLASAFAAYVSRTRRVCHVDLSLEPQWTASYEPVPVAPNMFACCIRRDPALREYLIRKIKIKKLADVLMQNTHVTALFDTAPGVEGMVMMGKIYDLARSGAYECIIVDAPATGHGVGLFQIPTIVTSLFRVGPIHDDARQVEEWLHLPQTRIRLVTLPEELPVQETLEYAALLSLSGLKVEQTLVNRYPSWLPSYNEKLLKSLRSLGDIPTIEKLICDEMDAVHRHMKTLHMQMQNTEFFKVPEFTAVDAPQGISQFASLWNRIESGIL